MRHRGKEAEDEAALTPRQQMRERISKRAALEFHDGMYGILTQKENNSVIIVRQVRVNGYRFIVCKSSLTDCF